MFDCPREEVGGRVSQGEGWDCPREEVGGGVFQGGHGVFQGRGFIYLYRVSQGGAGGLGVPEGQYIQLHKYCPRIHVYIYYCSYIHVYIYYCSHIYDYIYY